jgi:hypothetical protein
MATTTVNMIRNDTLPNLDVTLTDSDGEAINLTDSVVTFTMVDATDTTSQQVLEQSCLILSGQGTGMIRYLWDAEDTNTAGAYLAQFEIVYDNGGKLTVPTTDTLVIVIMEDYDAN